MDLIPSSVLASIGVGTVYQVTRLPGNENENYLVEASDRSIVVKRLRSAYSVIDIEAEGLYRRRLVESGLPITYYLPFNDGCFTFSDGTFTYVATVYAPGEVAAYSQNLAAQMGTLLARIHSTDVAELPKRTTWFRESYVDETVDQIDDKYEEVKKIFVNLYKRTPNFWKAKLPQGLVHGDLHNENIIVDAYGKIVSIIDWEETTVGTLLLDVAQAARFMSFRNGVCDESILSAFILVAPTRSPKWFFKIHSSAVC